MLGNDILKDMLALSIPVYGRVVHVDGMIQNCSILFILEYNEIGNEPVFQPYGKDRSECNYSISRFELNKFLINRAIEAGMKDIPLS